MRHVCSCLLAEVGSLARLFVYVCVPALLTEWTIKTTASTSTIASKNRFHIYKFVCAPVQKNKEAIVCAVLTNSIHNSLTINFRLFILLKFIQKIMYTPHHAMPRRTTPESKNKESELGEQQQQQPPHQWQWQQTCKPFMVATTMLCK